MGWGSLYDDPFSMGLLMGLLFLDTLIYSGLAWYLGLVRPFLVLNTPLVRSYTLPESSGSGEGEDCSLFCVPEFDARVVE